jgi:outer membrane protein TolC
MVMKRNPAVFAIGAVISFLAASAVPAFCAQGAPYRLTLGEAIRRGVEANVSVLVAGTRVMEADGSRERRLSVYLPHVHIETPFAYQTVNIKAQGISFPGVPSVVGPFTTWDFRAYADQTLLDLQSYHSLKASEQDQQARRNDYQDVRNQVIRQVAGLYLNAEFANAQVDAARSRVTFSESLEKLARDQHDAGAATGLDVLRAQVQLANDRQVLLVAQNAVKLSLMTLARSIGLSPGTPLELAETLEFKKLEAPQIEVAVTAALEDRADYRSLHAQRESLDEQLKASRSRYLPKLVLSGNYGGSGQHLGEIEPSGAIRINLVLSIFDLDREGERKEIDSRLQRIDQQLADQRFGVEQDVREAMLNLESAADQVVVAQAGLELAVRELELAGDRFKNGVANNIEVVNAQDSLARAQQNRIIALTSHVDAKIALARALGDTEKTYKLFLGIQ